MEKDESAGLSSPADFPSTDFISLSSFSPPACRHTRFQKAGTLTATGHGERQRPG